MANAADVGSSDGAPEIEITEGFRVGDLAAVVQLHSEVYAAEYGLDATFEAYVAEPLAQFAKARALNGERAGLIWFARTPDGVVGSLALIDGGDDLDAIRWVILTRALRGRGVGRALMQKAIDAAAARGKRSVELWTFDELKAAIALYEKCGFQNVERRTVQQWGKTINEVRMRRDLVHI
ncbi:MAG: GNAT family N-acetyltransferase [Pseudomonadota bacterium]